MLFAAGMTEWQFVAIAAAALGLFGGSAIFWFLNRVRELFVFSRPKHKQVTVRQILALKNQPSPRRTLWQKVTRQKPPLPQPRVPLELLMTEIRQKNSELALEVLMRELTPLQLESLRDKLRSHRK